MIFDPAAPLAVLERVLVCLIRVYPCASAAKSSTGLLAVNHPRNTELIDAHTETWRPERLLEWHLHVAVFRQCVKDAFPLSDVFEVERHIDALWLFLVVGRTISSHQH